MKVTQITKKENIKTQKEWQSHSRHQHNTHDGGQAMGEEVMHVQMSRCGKYTGEWSEQQ